MKRININHLRVINFFKSKKGKNKISDYEHFLSKHVSIPTARKIVKELIEFGIVKVIKSSTDRRVKWLILVEKDIKKYL